MELSTLILTIVIILPFFIQFHYLLDDPWVLCRAFHYYSSKSRHKIQKAPRLIVHYPKLHTRRFPSNSMNSINASETSLKNASKTVSQKIANTLDDTSLECSSSSLDTVNGMPAFPAKSLINSCPQNSGKSLERKIYGQSQSHTPIMLKTLHNNYSMHVNSNPKDINVKSGCTDFIHEKPSTVTNNAQVEFLYSRDLFLFEYRKRPNVKSEGTQSDNRKTGSSRIFRF